MRLKAAVICGVVLALLSTACAGKDDKGGSSAAPRPRSTATIKIASPMAGDVLEAGKVEVDLDLKGGRILKKASRNLTPDTGHIHLFLDGDVVSQTFKLSQTITVKPGRHLLMAEFVAADHGSFNPRPLDSITFEVES
jgi:hypothetical protein